MSATPVTSPTRPRCVVDRVFDRGDTIFARYSFSSERGFTPQNLPGFGALHDNLSQNGGLGWKRVINPTLVNIASVTVSRLACIALRKTVSRTTSFPSSESRASVSAAKGAFGAPWFEVQGYCGIGDISPPLPCTPGTPSSRPRTLTWQMGRTASSLVRVTAGHLADVGLLSESRLLPVHQWLHHTNRNQR